VGSSVMMLGAKGLTFRTLPLSFYKTTGCRGSLSVNMTEKIFHRNSFVAYDRIQKLRFEQQQFCQPSDTPPQTMTQSSMKASKSGFTTSAWVVHMPCGKP
jgi:hypothetical protein